MVFAYEFIPVFLRLLYFVAPLVGFLMLMICVLALSIGKREGWSRTDSIYYGFITAMTIGYGDFRPALTRNKMLSIVIGFLGLLMVGIFVALAVQAVSVVHDSGRAPGDPVLPSTVPMD